jgi:hypothetical protein
MYNTNTYNSRYFNNVIVQDDIVIKSSENIKKIKAEYFYYYNLPESAQRYFVQPFDFQITNNVASYKMENINTPNAAELMLSDKLSKDSFLLILNKIDNFKKELPIQRNNAALQSKHLVIDKTEKRISNSNNEDQKLLQRIKNAYAHFSKYRVNWDSVISHGDLCLSNVLWIDEYKAIKFIDPRGAMVKNDIYMDEYYDLSKISHSVINGYESVIYNKPRTNDYLKDTLLEYINKKNIVIELLMVYEASLFLSMTPLHLDRPTNVLLFKDTCDRILKKIGF